MKSVVKAGLAGVLTLTLFATQALAANRTTTATGSACLPDNETDNFTRTSTGFILYSGSDVHCPVFLDTLTTDLADTDVYVNLPANTSATCYLAVISSTGSLIDSANSTTTSDAAGADIDFPALTAGTGASNSVSLRCSLPDSGRIISYMVNED